MRETRVLVDELEESCAKLEAVKQSTWARGGRGPRGPRS